jgi:hypothetical protein
MPGLSSNAHASAVAADSADAWRASAGSSNPESSVDTSPQPATPAATHPAMNNSIASLHFLMMTLLDTPHARVTPRSLEAMSSGFSLVPVV